MSRRQLGAAGALVGAAAILATGWAVTRRGEHEHLGALLDRVVREGAPGALVLVHDRRTTRVEARGVAAVDSDLPMAEALRFRVGSVTKTFVAALVLGLVEEGSLRLDDTVEQWAPGLVPGGSAITVRQLLSHTSGLPDYVDDPRVLAEPERRWRVAELVSIAVAQDTRAASGGRYRYASTNYLLLGLIAERAGGAPLRRLLTGRIFRPLGLHHTSYVLGMINGANVEGHRAPSHQGVVTGPPVEVEEAAWWAGSAGAIVSTVGDVDRFFAALLGGRLLRPALLNEMETLVPAGRNRYGLGIAVFPTPCGPAWGHTGNVQGTVTVAWSTRDATRRVVLVVNTYPLSPELEAAVRRVQVAAFCEPA